MKQFQIDTALKYEEVKAVRFFLWIFYLILTPYDIAYYFIFPYFNEDQVGLPDRGMGFLFHFFLFALLPFAIYLIKRGHPEKIKYIYFFSFILLDIINNFMIYWGTNETFGSGHILELYFLLFSPIFVNKRFFWIITIILFLKYLITGFIFQSAKVLFALGLILFISFIAWILLTRFQSYLNTFTAIHNDLRKKEKFAVIGQMAAAIAHEIKNPLASLKGFTQLQQEKDNGDAQYYSIMLNEIDRINDIVNDLLILGKPHSGMKGDKNLYDIISYVISFIEPHANRKSIEFKLEVDHSVRVYCDENQMKQVFINIIKNAMEAMPEGGTISINTTSIDNYVSILVKDEGCGIEPAQVEKLGSPFYTTKENGTGLGLMVTKKIIEEHDGIFGIQSVVGEGTSVTIKLPICKGIWIKENQPNKYN